MRLILPRVYPITDRQLSGLSHAAQVERLIDGGATLIQLREKHIVSADFCRDAEAASKIADAARVALIINDRLDIAMATGAAGVHLGQDDLPVEAARRLMKPESLIGFSTHTVAQVEAAALLPIDYLAFGPIFATGTKLNHEPAVGPDKLRAIRSIAADLPLVAIGGIKASNLREVLSAGADSAAVISAVMADPSKIAENMQRMLSLANESSRT